MKKVTAGLLVPLLTKDTNIIETIDHQYELYQNELMNITGLVISFPDFTKLEISLRETFLNNLKFLVQELKFNTTIKENFKKLREIVEISQIELTLEGPSHIESIELQGKDASTTILHVNILDSQSNIAKFFLNLIQIEERSQN